MKMRLATPSLLVDLRKLTNLRGIERSNGGFRIGALTTHAEISQSDDLGVMALAAGKIADQQGRNRGTIGGSPAPGDSASHPPPVLLAREGAGVAHSPNPERAVAARDPL